MLETFFAVVGAIAIVGAAVVLWRYFSSLDRRLKALEEERVYQR